MERAFPRHAYSSADNWGTCSSLGAYSPLVMMSLSSSQTHILVYPREYVFVSWISSSSPKVSKLRVMSTYPNCQHCYKRAWEKLSPYDIFPVEVRHGVRRSQANRPRVHIMYCSCKRRNA